MKKILLSLGMLVWASASICAQQTHNVAPTSFFAPGVVKDMGQAPACIQKTLAPMAWQPSQPSRIAKANEDNQETLAYLFVDGADIPYGIDGWADVPSIEAVFGRIEAAKLKPYAGYTIVGIAFIVSSSLGDVPSLIAMERRTNGYVTVAGGNIDSYEISSAENGFVLNEIGVTQEYVIPDNPNDIIFGYSYTQQHTDTNADKPVYLGKTTDYEHGYYALGTLQVGQRGIYHVSSTTFPYALCVQMLVSKGGTTAIIGINGEQQAQVVERFAPDGTRLTTPVKGLSIEKMSDGTTRKVFRQ